MSDELARALRELAAQHETPPRLDAARVRDLARRRSRRRRATAVLGTAVTAACALAALAFTLHPDDPGGRRQLPGTASDRPTTGTPTSPPVPTPAPAGVLDLGGHTLTVGDRVMRVDSHSFDRFPPGSRMTVVAKADLRLLPLEAGAGAGGQEVKEIKVPYLVELRTSDGEPVYAGALAFDTRALAGLAAGTGWVGMDIRDAEWFYQRIRVGDRIEITSTAAPDAQATTAVPDTAGTGAAPEPAGTAAAPEPPGTAAVPQAAGTAAVPGTATTARAGTAAARTEAAEADRAP
ncbi:MULTISPECIES: hypothetical protein [Streptomyces]|uniref:YkuD domain-containing protein n=1 Tax=Streptomyces virens TaxID=285572 RepID=A0ABP6Q1P3_9ACTN|nr:hypothetical protein [Streptomyces calvus]MBA8974740.1 hypothetical protein [Streptomyces calvus]